jgi:xanthine permease XanP
VDGKAGAADVPAQERPLPVGGLLLNGLQHVAIITPIGLVFPLLVLRAAQADHALQAAVISASLLALGIGSLLLCWRGRALGSGFLAPAVFTAAYLPGSLAAAHLGGLPLVFGMTLFAGGCEIALSFLLRRLRPYLPAEIAGLAVVMIGLILGLLGFRLLLGLDGRGTGMTAPGIDGAGIDGVAVAVGLFALALIVALNVWGSGPVRTFSVLIGLAAAFPLAALLGKVDGAPIDLALRQGIVTLPSLPLLVPSFDWSLVPPFLVGALACALRATGDITTCQKIADADWVRPDFGSIERGVRADGIGTVIAGALGTVGTNTFSASVGLSQATGVIQRRVSFAIGGIFVALAFVPPIVGVAVAMPPALSGAMLLFASAFILANGLGIVVSRLLDSRRVLAIGLALILGISHDVFVEFYTTLPEWLRSVSGSSLVVAMVVALGLNAVFRLGVKRSVRLEAPLDAELLSRVVELCREQGPLWGARRDVMERVTNGLTEAVELARARGVEGAPLTLRLDYDEFRIVAEVGFAVAAAPPPTEAADPTIDALGLAELEVRLMRHFADRLSLTERDGRLGLRLRFES